MVHERVMEKLAILADAAKYDVSCSSSAGQNKRKNSNKGLGDTGNGICHAYTEDGRCVSLLKILLTNHCIFDCAYCVSRKSNDIKRAAFTVQEVVDLTIGFYRRNYIEGLFLSSGIFDNPDFTMERLVRIAKKLRLEENFNGYIHLKAIPGASDELIKEAGMYADRLSVNVEMPTEKSLKLLAPEKNHADVIKPMEYLKNEIIGYKEEKKSNFKAPLFAPAGQSTQMVIGATQENDLEILGMANYFYEQMNMRRVYYSGYVPISYDSRLPEIGTPVPMIRENRLYQADWLIRFYGFNVNEIVGFDQPNLDLDIDPKLGWALRNLNQFPVDINSADLELILRIPGIGVTSAQKIVRARKFKRLQPEDLKKLGIAYSRSKFFLAFSSPFYLQKDLSSMQIKEQILNIQNSKYKNNFSNQLSLFQ
ncbi:putative DNA modification/repair radical SAM protein [Flavobacterium nitrogenifigens]|uniref:DNA modification/repair radical SAM protein n=2 Tax=Flavobacterium TaxID=237 RepID=A0ABR6QAK3_9FLAO|nr:MULTISPECIES: putative DNA modification/repair radical SAM protein [Flavobacterium]MBB4799990.1 putative DNA modification/repair radical SAM protein [Flavobacterium nitrogenifigens]MBB6386260.1 putative DNA modification/repair radical SAM protein [Flavobacterium notoginsengisoli]